MSHKTSLIIRLIVLCVAFFLVLGLFFTLLLSGGIFNFPLALASDSAFTQPGESSTFSSVTSLEVALVGAHVVVEETDIEQIRVTDNSTGNTRHELFTDGNRLHLRAQKRFFPFFSFDSTSNGSFLIEVPHGQALEYDIVTVSGDITLNAPSDDDLQMETVNGNILVLQSGQELEAHTVSGNMEIESPFTDLSLNTVSGESYLLADAGTRNIQMDSVSGDFHVQISDVSECSIELDSVSGDIENRYDTLSLSAGDAILEIEADSVSGDLILGDWR